MRYPNEPSPLQTFEQISIFIGQSHKVAQHVWDFMDFMADLNTIHEDATMKLFVNTLRGIATHSFHRSCPGCVFNLVFIRDFLQIL